MVPMAFHSLPNQALPLRRHIYLVVSQRERPISSIMNGYKSGTRPAEGRDLKASQKQEPLFVADIELTA